MDTAATVPCGQAALGKTLPTTPHQNGCATPHKHGQADSPRAYKQQQTLHMWPITWQALFWFTHNFAHLSDTQAANMTTLCVRCAAWPLWHRGSSSSNTAVQQ